MRLKARTAKWLPLLTSLLSGIALISSWAVASPPGGSPDEPGHFVTIYCTSASYSSNCLDPKLSSLDLNPVKSISSCYLVQRDRGVGCEKSNMFEKLSAGSSSELNKYAENNYYRFLGLFTSEYYILSLLFMRVINGSIFLFILFLSIYLLPAKHRQFFIISTFVVVVPLGIYLVSSINTSSWIIIGSIGMWVSLYSLLYEYGKKNVHFKLVFLRILLFILSGTLIISSRSDGIYLFMIILFSVSIIFITKLIIKYFNNYLNSSLVKFITFTFILLSAIFIFFQMKDRAQVTFTDNEFNVPDRLFDNTSRFPHLLLGPMGTWGLGWLDVWLTPITAIVMIFIFLGLAFTAIRNLDFPHTLSVLIIFMSSIVLPMLILMFSGYRVGEWVQPRYLLPLYFPLLGILLISSVPKLLLNKLHMYVIVAGISIAHSAALFTNLERYLRGQNTYSYNLNFALEWWWEQLPSPNYVWVAGSISFTILFLTLNELTKQEKTKN